MSLLKKVVIAVAVFVFFLLLNLPAQQVISRIAVNGLSIGNVSGTIWRGHLSQAQMLGVGFSNIQWQLNPLTLLLGNISADLNIGSKRAADQVFFAGQVSISMGDVSVNNAEAYLPASLVAQHAQLPIPVKLGGRFKLNIDSYHTAQPYCEQLIGKAQWLNSEVQGLSGMIKLNNFIADLGCENGSLVLNVDRQNLLALQGKLVINPSQKVTVNLVAKPAESLPKDVHQAFAFIAKKTPQGEYQIRL